MKKIVIFNASSFIYGAERGLLNLIKAFKNKFDITVVVPGKGPLAGKIKEVNPSVKVITFPLAILMFSFSPLYFVRFVFLFFVDLFFFLFYINHNDIEIISTNSLLLAFPALCARLLGRPHIWHIREVFPYKFMNYILSSYAEIFSSQIICQSEFINRKLYLDNKTDVIYEPLDKGDYKVYERNKARRILRVPSQAVVVSIISRIHPAKGQYEFLVNLRELLCKNRDVVILIAGNVNLLTLRNRIYKRRIDEFIRKHNLENVLITGFIENIGLVLSATDICVFPFKRAEPFGIAAAEALAWGLDTFYPFSGGLREVHNIFKRGNAFRIDDIVKRIISCKHSSNKAVSLNIPDELSLSRYQDTVVKIYKNVA